MRKCEVIFARALRAGDRGGAFRAVDIISMVIIFFVGLIVSVMGTLIGGSSVFTIPTLLLLGVPPHTAIGTDRFGIMGITIAGWYQFHRKGLVDYKTGIILAIPLLKISTHRTG